MYKADDTDVPGLGSFSAWLNTRTAPARGQEGKFWGGFAYPTVVDTVKAGGRLAGGVSTFLSDLMGSAMQLPAGGILATSDRVDRQLAAVDWMNAMEKAKDLLAWSDNERQSAYDTVFTDDSTRTYDTPSDAKDAFRTTPTDLAKSAALGVRDLVGMPFAIVADQDHDSPMAFPAKMLFDGNGLLTREYEGSVINDFMETAAFSAGPKVRPAAKPKAKVRQASKGGDSFAQSRGLFAGDSVPETIFGIEVVSDPSKYTEADLAFFEEHPEAGGYYDTGDSSPDDGSAEGAPVQADYPTYYGTRADGSFKGTGWLGELPLKGGGVATEYSVGVNLNGKETDIPTLVPTLTKEEVKAMTQDIIPGGKPVPEAIVRKAAEHAKARIAKGQSVWANDGEPWSEDNAWSLRFEVPPERVVGADGSVRYNVHYDNYGHYDIGGYTSYWSFKNNHLIEHSNGGSIPEKSFVKGIEEKDRYLRKLADDVYRAYGVDPKKLPEGTKTAVRDINFSVKGGTLLPAKSPTFAGIVRDMRKSGATPEDAFAVAMALEQDTYGMVQKGSRKVHNYVRHANRGDLAARALLESKNPAVRSLGEAYAKSAGFTGGSGYDNSQKEVRFGHSWADFSTRMREVAKVADKMKLKYTGWTK